MVEAVVVITTVLANILFIMIRSCRKVQLDIGFDDEGDSADSNALKDHNKDFLASETNQFWINLINQTVGPLTIQAFLYWYFKVGGKEEFMDETESSILLVQLGLQAVQSICLIYVMIIPAVPRCCQKNFGCFKYITWLMTISFFFLVPICAIFHWIAFIKSAVSNENEIRGWIFCYPLMCAFTIVFYVLFISEAFRYLKGELFV